MFGLVLLVVVPFQIALFITMFWIASKFNKYEKIAIDMLTRKDSNYNTIERKIIKFIDDSQNHLPSAIEKNITIGYKVLERLLGKIN